MFAPIDTSFFLNDLTLISHTRDWAQVTSPAPSQLAGGTEHRCAYALVCGRDVEGMQLLQELCLCVFLRIETVLLSCSLISCDERRVGSFQGEHGATLRVFQKR